MAIVRGAFSQLFYPGKVFFSDDLEEMLKIREQDEMAILHPDTSAIPIWRKRPTRVEHPLIGWRAWGIHLWRLPRLSDVPRTDAYLTSVAADCTWEGPVLRAHKRPVDPKYWDAIREKKLTDPDEYYRTMQDTFMLAGVWAVKTEKQAQEVMSSYHVAAYGRIKMWGRVAKFKLGYRAEICMIDKIWVGKSNLLRIPNNRNDERDMPYILEQIQQIKDALSRRYECEVEFIP